MKSSRFRLTVDLVLIASMVALSFLPAVGTEEGHFVVAAKSLRILAGIYTLLVVLANSILGRRSRLIVDVTFALFLASMAWFETFPAGNHVREAAIYAAISGIVAMLAVMGIREPRRVTA
ncbi:MAG: hypothetical protein ACJ74H_00320 [Thermoanaerobaculia bacterium]